MGASHPTCSANLELQPGTITGMLERNGSCKTTAMAVVLGLTSAGRDGRVTMYAEGSPPPYWPNGILVVVLSSLAALTVVLGGRGLGRVEVAE